MKNVNKSNSSISITLVSLAKASKPTHRSQAGRNSQPPQYHHKASRLDEKMKSRIGALNRKLSNRNYTRTHRNYNGRGTRGGAAAVTSRARPEAITPGNIHTAPVFPALLALLLLQSFISKGAEEMREQYSRATQRLQEPSEFGLP